MDYLISTSPGNENIQHPIESQNVILVNVEEDSKIFYHRPDIRYRSVYCLLLLCFVLEW